MPAYEYACRACRKDFTVYCSVREYEAKPKVLCPHCGSGHVERRIASFFAKTSRKS